MKRALLIFFVFVIFQGAKSQTSQGTDFWVAPTYPFYNNDSFYLAVASEKPTTAYMEFPLLGYSDSVTLGYNEIKYLKVPKSIRLSYYYYNTGGGNKVGENAIHVTSKLPVRIYAFSEGRYYSCGATAVYPTAVQQPGGIYYPYKSRYYWSGGGSSSYKVFFFSVIGIDDSVTVDFKSNVTMSNLPTGGKITLKRGEIVRLYTWAFGVDPTLSVHASPGKRIAVYTENFYDYALNNCFQYDLMYEQILSDNILGTNYILTPYMYHKKGYDYTITAAENSTILKKNGSSIDTLDIGETYYGRIYGDSSVLISTDKPSNCWQKNILDTCLGWGWGSWYTGPSIASISTNEQLITDATVSVPTGTNFPDNYINIITTKAGKDSVWLDGNAIPGGEFKSILGGDYFLYRDTILGGNHRITCNYGFISYIYGRGQYGGYSYNASSGLQSLKRFILSKTYKSCDTGRIVRLTSEGDPGKNYTWTINGQTDTGLTAYFHINKPGRYPVKLNYTLTRNNKADSVLGYVDVIGDEELDFIVGKDLNICKNSYSITLPSTKLFTYNWSNGSTSNTQNFTGNGIYSVIITNTRSGCKFYDTAVLALYDKITPDFSISMKERCPGIPIYLGNTTTKGVNDSITRYQWYQDGQPSANTKDDTVKYAYPGTYVFKMIVTSKNGCQDSITKDFKVQDNPKVIAGLRTFDSCYQRSSYRFNSQSSLTVGKIVRFQWIFDDGDTSFVKNQAVRGFKDSGIHWYRFAAFSDAGCRDTTPYQYFKVHSAPSPSFNVTDSSVCKSGNYFNVFNTTNNYSRPSRYEWDWGNGSGETFEQPGYINYDDTGRYTIKLVAAYLNTGCSDTFRREVRILPNPKASFVIDSLNSCLKHNYYAVHETGDAKGSAVRYSTWNWGDGTTTKDTANFRKKYSKAGTYRIKVYFSTGKGCLDSAQRNAIVYTSPIAAFSIVDSAICGNQNFFEISNTSTGPGNAQYLWNWDGKTNTAKSPGKLTFSGYGSFPIQMTITDPLVKCSDTAYRNVTVLKGISLNPKLSDTVLCDAKNSIQFTDSTDYGNITPRHIWKFSASETDTLMGKTVSKQFTSPGIKTIQFIGGIPGTCADTIDVNVRIKYSDKPVKISQNLYYPCVSGGADFDGIETEGSGWNYSWDFDGISTASVKNPLAVGFTDTGKKTIYLTVKDAAGCTFKDTSYLTILEAPQVSITNLYKDSQCMKGHLFSLQANASKTSGTVQYNWDLDDGKSSASNATGNITYATEGEKDILLEITDANGCKAQANATLSIFISPRIQISSDTICEGETAEIFANTTPSTLSSATKWLLNGIADGSGSSYQYFGNAASNNTIQAIISTVDGCSDSSGIENIVVLNKPVARFGVDILNAIGSGVPVVFLDSSTGATKWKWYTGDGTTGSNKNFQYIYNQLGFKTVGLAVQNDQGCSDSTFKTIFVTSDELIYIPSSFSPNGDRLNEVFKPEGLSAVKTFYMVIYNTWGEKVFETTDPANGWDGTYKGEPVMQGSYAYLINLVYLTGKRQVEKGNLTLLR